MTRFMDGQVDYLYSILMLSASLLIFPNEANDTLKLIRQKMEIDPNPPRFAIESSCRAGWPQTAVSGSVVTAPFRAAVNTSASGVWRESKRKNY